MDSTRIEGIINELPGTIPKFSEPQKDDSDITLFQLMDEVANGRKLMNFLFSSETLPTEKKLLQNSGLLHREHVIAGQWYDEEKRGSTQVTSATLQLDTPVIFSWSDSDRNIFNSSGESPKLENKKERKQVTTNQRLLKNVSTGLKDLGLDNIELMKSEENFFSDELNNPYNTKHGNFSQGSLNKEWKKSDFKVDPLQPFVVKELPKKKKINEEPEAPKSKSKRKSILWFWGKGKSSKSKDEKHKKSSNSKTKLPNTSEEDIRITPKKKKDIIPRPTAQEDDDIWDHDLEPSSEEEQVIGLGLQRVSVDIDTHEEVVRNFQPSDDVILAEPTALQSEEDDDDFGEFQQVAEVPVETKQTSLLNDLLDLEDTSTKAPLSTHPPPPIDNTFVPLQPKKK